MKIFIIFGSSFCNFFDNFFITYPVLNFGADDIYIKLFQKKFLFQNFHETNRNVYDFIFSFLSQKNSSQLIVVLLKKKIFFYLQEYPNGNVPLWDPASGASNTVKIPKSQPGGRSPLVCALRIILLFFDAADIFRVLVHTMTRKMSVEPTTIQKKIHKNFSLYPKQR